jgi:F1F0 ATPase subunit 2
MMSWTMNEWIIFLFAVIAGATLGLLYFGGLWLTILRLPASRHPVLLTFGSFIGRSAVILAGFAMISGGQWERLTACVVGFLLARQFYVFRLRPVQRQIRT